LSMRCTLVFNQDSIWAYGPGVAYLRFFSFGSGRELLNGPQASLRDARPFLIYFRYVRVILCREAGIVRRHEDANIEGFCDHPPRAAGSDSSTLNHHNIHYDY
jgi:hypothetical protein